MSYTTEKQDKGQIKLTVTVTPEEYGKYLNRAAERISERKTVKGFRKGKVPFDIMQQQVGDMAILQEALQDIVKATFSGAIKKEGLDTIGMPEINVEKLAPDNNIVYTAVVAELPKIELADISKIKVELKKEPIVEKKVDETLDAIRGMHATEVLKNGPATGTDKIVIDMDMLDGNVPLEGGQAKNHQVYLSEQHYIPGFNKELEGVKKGDKKTFDLTFPKTHYQKHLAGKKVTFKVNVKEVYERQLPELSDDLAKTLGQESVAKLKELIRNNMEVEAEQKANQKVEIAILDQLIEKSTFEPIPDVLIDAERQKMFYELKRDLEKNGVEISQYLADIKKDEKTLSEDFREQAEKRAKAALISRSVSKENNLTVTDDELEAEIKILETTYAKNKEYLDNLKRSEVRDTITMTLQNRKVIDWLKKQILNTEKKK